MARNWYLIRNLSDFNEGLESGKYRGGLQGRTIGSNTWYLVKADESVFPNDYAWLDEQYLALRNSSLIVGAEDQFIYRFYVFLRDQLKRNPDYIDPRVLPFNFRVGFNDFEENPYKESSYFANGAVAVETFEAYDYDLKSGRAFAVGESRHVYEWQTRDVPVIDYVLSQDIIDEFYPIEGVNTLTSEERDGNKRVRVRRSWVNPDGSLRLEGSDGIHAHGRQRRAQRHDHYSKRIVDLIVKAGIANATQAAKFVPRFVKTYANDYNLYLTDNDAGLDEARDEPGFSIAFRDDATPQFDPVLNYVVPDSEPWLTDFPDAVGKAVRDWSAEVYNGQSD